MAYTDTSAVAGLVKAAYDRYVEFALRSVPMFRDLVDKRPVQQAMPGSSVVFSLYNDLSSATTALTENTDPTAVAISDVSTVTVTLAEYGNVVISSKKLSNFAFADVDPAIANIVAFNMADSIDKLVVTVARAGTNVLYANPAHASTVTTVATDTLTGASIRKSVAKLRAGNSVPREAMLYAAYVHPEAAHDLRSETGALAFEDINKFTDPSGVLKGVVGVLGGAYFVETPRAYNATDGASSARVYRTLICGKQAIAEATAVEPGIVIGPVVDSLMRSRPIGWYSLQGWARLREASLYRVESGSSIAA